MAPTPPNPMIGLLYHWTGGLAAASFYIPFKRVRGWAWETYWLVGGVFSWILAPMLLAGLLVPGVREVIMHAPVKTIGVTYFWGVMWGIGGLTFGLSMRYLGIALGYAIALGLCTAFGTLMPPLFEGTMGQIAREHSGQIILLGIAICLGGIVLSGLAGISKERELSAEQKQSTVKEFRFVKGLLVAIFAGVMSASFAYGLSSGKPIAEIAKTKLAASGGSELWQNLPILVVILWGGFTTNFLWCVGLNIKNRTARQYISTRPAELSDSFADIAATEAVGMLDASSAEVKPETKTTSVSVVSLPRNTGSIPLLSNYVLSAIAGVTWYLQFFFYSMGQTKMGKYDFSSWTLHMASIIIFSTLWGVALKEWKGTSRRTHGLIGLGLSVLILSTVVVGYGNYVKAAGH